MGEDQTSYAFKFYKERNVIKEIQYTEQLCDGVETVAKTLQVGACNEVDGRFYFVEYQPERPTVSSVPPSSEQHETSASSHTDSSSPSQSRPAPDESESSRATGVVLLTVLLLVVFL